MVQQPDRLLCGVRRDRVWAEESSTRSVAEVLSVVEPDRAALLTLGADGTYVAMSVRVPKDSRPRHASGFLPTPEGLPVQAALGQRVRVWRVSDGTWLDPFAAWTTSWGARWSPDGQLLAAFVHRGHQAPSVAVWNSSTTPPRRLTDGDGRWPPRGSSDVRGDYQAPRWLDQDTVIWHREGFGFVTVSLDIPDVIVTLTGGTTRTMAPRRRRPHAVPKR